MSERCPTDCLERPLCRAQKRLGGLVGTYPLPFLVVPVVLTLVLGVGFMNLRSLEANDIESQFTPRWGPAKAERRVAQERFPTRDAENFSAPRLTSEGVYASLVMVANDSNILTAKYFTNVVWQLDREVQGIRSADGHTYEQLCARHLGSCASPNPVLSAVENDPARIEVLLRNLTFPLWQGNIFLGVFLGGVTLRPPGRGEDVSLSRRRPVEAAKALRLFYYLQEDDPKMREASLKWVKAFLARIPKVLTSLNLLSVKVAYFSSISRQEEFEKSAKEVIPLFSVTYFLTILFSIVSCSRCDCVRTKVGVAAFGVLSSGLAVVSSFGLLLFCGFPFAITAANAPFLILGVGVDDMFILVSCWQKTKVKDIVRDRMTDTYARAAVSVTITTLTDVLAFYIGVATPFPSIQSFCIYTGTAFIFCYIYNLTFLGAILALNGRREESNRHWLTCKIVPTEIQDSRGCAYNKCCVGGSYDETTGAEFEHPMNVFFRNYFGPFLVHICTKVLVVLLYLAYLGSSIYGCTRVKEGIDLRNLANDRSYVIQYYNLSGTYFKEYGPRVMVIVTIRISYWNSFVREDFESCIQVIENSTYVDQYLTESWLKIYVAVASRMSQDIDNQDSFIGNLSLLEDVNPDSLLDINITQQEITASRYFLQTVNVTSSVDELNLIEQLRFLAEDCIIPLVVYHPAFIYFDQYLVIAQNTIQNVLIATGAMLLISLLLIPNPLCSLWVTFAIGSVIVGVTGFMAFWKVNLDSISMINLVLCIGFSVDFSAHISYAFVSSEKSSVNDKAVDALYHHGYPVFQGAVSTILGVLVLAISSSYIFRTFFKIMFLVILFGAIHGLIFIPVFLTFFGLC